MLNLFQLNQIQRSTFTVKHRFGKKWEIIGTYQVDFEIVEIDD